MKSVEFVSAQNVKVEYEYATVVQRTTATIIDATTVAVYLIILFVVISGTNSEYTLLWELIVMKIPWIFYHPILEYLTHGQTLGKYAMGIRVVTYHGERPGLREIFTRWIFKGHFLWIAFSFFASIEQLLFAGMTRFTDEDMLLIKNTIQRVRLEGEVRIFLSLVYHLTLLLPLTVWKSNIREFWNLLKTIRALFDCLVRFGDQNFLFIAFYLSLRCNFIH